MSTQTIEFKHLRADQIGDEPGLETKVLDPAKGVVEAIVSVTNIVDHVGDIIMPGAYTKVLTQRKPKVCWGHDWKNPVGKVLDAVELMPGDPRLPLTLQQKGAGALKATMQFNLNTQRGRDAYEDVRFWEDQGEWSIGYDAQGVNAKTMKNQQGNREIHDFHGLYEFSPVLFGAAPLTSTIDVKSADLAVLTAPEGTLPWTVEPDPDVAEFMRITGKTLDVKRDFTPAARDKAKDDGAAMPGKDGGKPRFPIYNRNDLKNAIRLAGQADDTDAVHAHITKRAKALGLEDALPDSWTKTLAGTLEFKAMYEVKITTSESARRAWATRRGGPPNKPPHMGGAARAAGAGVSEGERIDLQSALRKKHGSNSRRLEGAQELYLEGRSQGLNHAQAMRRAVKADDLEVETKANFSERARRAWRTRRGGRPLPQNEAQAAARDPQYRNVREQNARYDAEHPRFDAQHPRPRGLRSSREPAAAPAAPRETNASARAIEDRQQERHDALRHFSGDNDALDAYKAARDAGKDHIDAMSAAEKAKRPKHVADAVATLKKQGFSDAEASKFAKDHADELQSVFSGLGGNDNAGIDVYFNARANSMDHGDAIQLAGIAMTGFNELTKRGFSDAEARDFATNHTGDLVKMQDEFGWHGPQAQLYLDARANGRDHAGAMQLARDAKS